MLTFYQTSVEVGLLCLAVIAWLTLTSVSASSPSMSWFKYALKKVSKLNIYNFCFALRMMPKTLLNFYLTCFSMTFVSLTEAGNLIMSCSWCSSNFFGCIFIALIDVKVGQIDVLLLVAFHWGLMTFWASRWHYRSWALALFPFLSLASCCCSTLHASRWVSSTLPGVHAAARPSMPLDVWLESTESACTAGCAAVCAASCCTACWPCNFLSQSRAGR